MKPDFEHIERLVEENAVEELEALLASDPEIAERYLELCRLKADLSLSSALEDALKVVDIDSCEPTKVAMPRIAIGLAAAAAIAVAVITLINKPSNEPVKIVKDEAEKIDKPKTSAPEIYALSDKHPALSGNGKVRGGIPVATGQLPNKIGFNRHVRAILSENCFHCHGPDGNTRKADLRLDTREGALAAIEPGNAEASELVTRLFSGDPDEQMPPPDSGRHLNDEQREILAKWVEQGAEYQEHWAFVPVAKEEPPAAKGDTVQNSIDRFVQANLQEKGIQPSPEAERHTLIRRLSFDLIGLAPTPEEVRSFVEDNSLEAYERLVDRLLASPHYGERMALPWLDAARYADSNGFQQDGDRHSYIWRDWVVKAMNENLPFDQFTIQQLAGDLLPDPSQDQLIATAFNRNHMLNGEGGAIAEEQRHNNVFDRVDTTSTIFLGLTLACAQCHDHKYDQLTQKEYYEFFAYFNNLPETGKVDTRKGRIQYAKPVLVIAEEEQKVREKAYYKERAPYSKLIKENKEAIGVAAGKWWDAGVPKEKLPKNLHAVIGRKFATLDGYNDRYVREAYLRVSENPQWKKAQTETDRITKALEDLQGKMPTLMVMGEREEVRPSFVLDRGDYESPTDPVEPNIPAVLHELPQDAPKNRLGLAKWIVDPANPLTSRVIVNRYWQHFFGIGLVKTAEDFGVQGEAPSHPALLDWLAAEFVESGWDVKHIQKLIVMSHTYRQSSRTRPMLQRDDPENRLLARSARFRLPSMLIRDQALQLAGLLKTEIGGKPVYPYQPDKLWFDFSLEKFKYTPDTGDKLYRRSLYTFWRRTLGPPNMFDTANRQVCMVKSKRTNTPLHALITLNDPTFVEAARVWAEQIVKSAPEPDLGSVFETATGREPTTEELAVLRGALEKARAHFQSHPQQAAEIFEVGDSPHDESLPTTEVASWTQVAQLILNLDEVLNRE